MNRTIADGFHVDGHWLETVEIPARGPNLPTIVMLHEGLGSIAHWKNFPSLLAQEIRARVFLYSRHGHGGSDPLTGPRTVCYMHHEARIVLPEILRKAGIERPLLLGHSDGASIAILYDGTFPESPAGLILEAPHVFVEDITVSSIAKARILYKETGLPQRLGRYHANADSLFRAWNDIWLDPRFRTWNIESFILFVARFWCFGELRTNMAQQNKWTPFSAQFLPRRLSCLITAGMRHIGDRCEATLAAISRFCRSRTWEI